MLGYVFAARIFFAPADSHPAAEFLQMLQDQRRRRNNHSGDRSIARNARFDAPHFTPLSQAICWVYLAIRSF